MPNVNITSDASGDYVLFSANPSTVPLPVNAAVSVTNYTGSVPLTGAASVHGQISVTTPGATASGATIVFNNPG